MRILVAPQEFKGTLTNREAAEAIARGLQRVMPDAEIDVLPVADGGPGTVEALVEATSGRYVESDVHDPLGRPLRARWGVLGDERTAAIEMAAASGLVLLQTEELEPRRTSTFGTGELISAALGGGFRHLIVGVGGSATNDGGAGAAQALGARLLDSSGIDLTPGGEALAQLDRIDVSALDRRLQECDVTIATDVTSPLCGRNGASLLYGRQKGASEAVARDLDGALAHYAGIIKRDLAVDVADVPGAGAAGGLAAGLIALAGAVVLPGFDVVAKATGFFSRLADVDAVVTGEGRLDRQTPFGKAAARVASAARDRGKLAVAIVGSLASSEAGEAFDAVFALVPAMATEDEARGRAAEYLELAAERAGDWLASR